ncbi:MAG: glycosyltransferase [bacterium]|nr:glycosyltransferase [bacterium]
METSSSSYLLSLIIPVYNNGIYLKEVCFNSLKKSTIFSNIEIIIVDDGSTDSTTVTIINDLSRQYDNIITYFFPSGGSGTASRARNYGIRLSTSQYVSYLDPDNEAINDGYYKLYLAIKDSEYDMVMGNIVVNNGFGSFKLNYYNKFMLSNHRKDTCSDGRQLLLSSNFSANSIQATIFRRQLIIDNTLAMADGAIGQDTIFFYSTVLCAKHIKAINELVHIYYNKNATSVTNTINPAYFTKRYLNEKYKLSILSQYNLLQDYYETKQDSYFKSYIFNKLRLLSYKDLYQARGIVSDIYELYDHQWHIKDLEMKRYFKQEDDWS